MFKMSLEGETPRGIVFSAVVYVLTMIFDAGKHMVQDVKEVVIDASEVIDANVVVDAAWFSMEYWGSVAENLVSALIICVPVFFLNVLLKRWRKRYGKNADKPTETHK